MVLIDTIIASGLTYSIFVNAYKIYMNKENIMRNIEKLEGETDITHISILRERYTSPMYINPETVMLPFGGGTQTEEYGVLWVLNNKNKQDKIYSQYGCSHNMTFNKFYINNFNFYNNFKHIK